MGRFYFKDKRVDRLARKKGYTSYEIFYSPISLWISYYISMLFITITSIGFFFIDYWLECAIFLLSAYLAAAYLNHSFIVTQDKLIIVNTNFPFTKTTVYNLSEIEDIDINKSGLIPGLMFPFFILVGNYVRVNAHNKSKRFYCVCLQTECYDENHTAKTIEDLTNALGNQGLIVHFELY
ncbi:hypothetical protein BKI52_39740 [marine bacterium AO1-C]|nr:hypothetical protein BKI52_39740 [marine bacterium AO1-C]